MGLIPYLRAALLAGTTACGTPDALDDHAEPPSSGRLEDNNLTREEVLQRFRADLPPARALAGGADSRDALVAKFMRALGAADGQAIAALAITRSEFAYLYYPTASRGLPPYDLEPEVLWSFLFERSTQGLRQALRLFGGTPVHLVSHSCGSGLVRQGENTIHGPCLVGWRGAKGDTVSARLFSQIIERGGRFKFLSYANGLN